MFWFILAVVSTWGLALVASSFGDPPRVSPNTPAGAYVPMYNFAEEPPQVPLYNFPEPEPQIPMWRDAHGRAIRSASALGRDA